LILDIWYVQNASFVLDLTIVVRHHEDDFIW